MSYNVLHQNGVGGIHIRSCPFSTFSLFSRRVSESESYHPQSRYRGVHWENGKWRAAVYYKGKTFRAGRHYYEEDAANAVNRKCEELGIPPRALCYNAKPREKKKRITKYHQEEKVRAKNASKKKVPWMSMTSK